MTQIPAGWYPDPAPAPAGGQPQHRWWDGQQWTEHVQPAAPPRAVEEPPTQPVTRYDPSSYPGRPDAYPGSYGQQPGAYGASYPGTPAAAYGDQLDGVARTPDGERLAGWWRRLGAYLLDGILVGVLSALVGWSLLHRVIDGYRAYFDQVVKAAENGTAAPSQSDLLSQVAGASAGFTVVAVVVSLVYNVLFLKARAATPGKLALGMRVRLRDRPGPLTWGTILVRWLVQNIATLLNVLPGIGAVAGLFPLLDGLWPLWDRHKQALHDKAARTNVVRTRG